MAQLVFNIPDDQVQRVVNALALFYGYRATDEQGNPNAETKAQYVRRRMADEMRARVKRIERQQQAEQIVITDPGIEAG